MTAPARRLAAVGALVLGVTLAHLLVAERALPSGFGDDSGRSQRPAIEVSFVHELLPAEAAAAPPPAAPAPRPRVARVPAVEAAASAPQMAEALPDALPLEPVREAPPEPTPAVVAEVSIDALAASTGPASASATSAAGSASASGLPAGAETAAAFEWPPSTRLNYTLSGDYRGPVEGRASVEWRRQGSRYQVLLELSIGPAFAPLVSRSITSEGEITPAGLHPTRYDEVTRTVLRDPRRLVVQMDDAQVTLAGGRVLPRPPGLQDSASQFVQLTWLFTTDPSRLREGRQIELPLALPRRIGQWVYEVGATELIDTPAGPVPAVHVKPRRDATRAGPGGEGVAPRPAGELSAEVWVAPGLQYLPVRMLIRQDAQTWVELRLAGLPQQAAESAPPTGR